MTDQTEHEKWAEAEQIFLQHVKDPEISSLYSAAKGEDREALRRLTEIAAPGRNRPHGPNKRETKANRAIELVYWLRRNTQ